MYVLNDLPILELDIYDPKTICDTWKHFDHYKERHTFSLT